MSALLPLESITIESVAGTYRLDIVTDPSPEDPYDSDMMVVTQVMHGGAWSAIKLAYRADEAIERKVIEALEDRDEISHEALERWLRLRGCREVRVDTVEDGSVLARYIDPGSAEALGYPDDSPEWRTVVREDLRVWRSYMYGDVVGYNLYDHAGVMVDSVYGFYGHSRSREQIIEEANMHVAGDAENMANMLARARESARYMARAWSSSQPLRMSIEALADDGGTTLRVRLPGGYGLRGKHTPPRAIDLEEGSYLTGELYQELLTVLEDIEYATEQL